jgi:hypothetical protein
MKGRAQNTGKRRRPRVGDIVAIPLRDEIYAYGKLYRDCAVGIFDYISSEICSAETVIENPECLWFGFDDYAIRQGRWPIIGRVEPRTEDDEWAPPVYIEDIIVPGKFRVYHKGEMRPASRKEIAGLQEQAFLSVRGLQEETENHFKARIGRLLSRKSSS